MRYKTKVTANLLRRDYMRTFAKDREYEKGMILNNHNCKEVNFYKMENEQKVKTVCGYCGDVKENDFNSLSVLEQIKAEYWSKKSGKSYAECEPCKKAMDYGLRSSRCLYCNKLAVYTVDEKFLKCFGCGAGLGLSEKTTQRNKLNREISTLKKASLSGG